jgi:hypothetical protein
VESTADLVVNATKSHAFQGALGVVQEMGVVCGLVTLEQQIDGAGVREFGKLSETTVTFIE